jgi:hypothetical protein
MAGLGPPMSAHRVHGGATHLRQRSTAAVVLTRPDPRPGGRESTPADRDPTGAAGGPSSGRSRWPAVLTWVVLGAAIAGLWALLLLGDSLGVSG